MGTAEPPMEHATSVDDAITSRQSVRRFLDKPVSRADMEALLEVARFAPSGTNTQPWKVYAIAGDVKAAISEEILAEYWRDGDSKNREYEYYPTEWFEPYLARRRACGWGLYGALGIRRDMREAIAAQAARNYVFFDAPVAFVFGIDRRLNVGSWMDLGMFLQNIMIAARGRGLDTCPQAALANYPHVIRRHVPIADREVVVCAMAVGYRDANAPENVWRTEREPVSAFTSWVGFE